MRFRAVILIICGLLLTASAPQEAESGLLVHRGETWFFHIENGQPAGARLAGKSDKALAGELSATLDFQGMTMLSVSNGSDIWYDYRAFIITKPGHKGNRISVCTLMGGGRGAFETWPESFPAIRLTDFHEVPAGQMQCR